MGNWKNYKLKSPHNTYKRKKTKYSAQDEELKNLVRKAISEVLKGVGKQKGKGSTVLADLLEEKSKTIGLTS